MPRTFGRSLVHISQVAGWCEADYPLVAVPSAEPDALDARIGALVAERIPDGATIQTGIGAIPNALLAAAPGPPRPRGAHRAVLRRAHGAGRRRRRRPGCASSSTAPRRSATFALGSERLYEFLDENAAVRALAGALRQRPPGHRPGAGLRLGQRHASRSTCSASAPPSRSAAGCSPAAAARRTSPRGHVLPGGQGFIVMRSATHHGHLPDRRPAPAGRRRHDHQEHRRQGGHRARRRRATWSIVAATGRRTHRHRGSRPSRPPDLRGQASRIAVIAFLGYTGRWWPLSRCRACPATGGWPDLAFSPGSSASSAARASSMPSSPRTFSVSEMLPSSSVIGPV